MRNPVRLPTLVAGGAGFLGFHLCKRLLREGSRVLCIDDMSTGRRQNLDELSNYDGFEFIHHDVTEPIDLRVDRVINLACPASPPVYQADPIRTTLVNVIGTRNLLRLARSNNARYVQASTSEIYGDPLVHPQPESYFGNVTTTGKRSCYDEGKRCAETLVFDYHRVHGVDVRIARIFNTFGPGMREDDGRVISNFVVQALQKKDVTVYGDGSQTRSFCYVDDLIDGLMRLAAKDTDFPRIVNLGNPHEIAILDLARLIIEMTGSTAKIVHLPEAAEDPRIRCPDITRAKAELNWEPSVALENGLKATIAFFEKDLVSDVAVRRAIWAGPKRNAQAAAAVTSLV
jgi:UDP-glucuronate decarboxylase